MAIRKKESQRIGSVLGRTFMLLGLVVLTSGLGHAACLLSALSEVPLKAKLSMLSWVIQATWQLLVPCLFGHATLLESFLQPSGCWWRLFLAFVCAG